MHNDNRGGGKLGVRVEFLDRRIIPLGDLAKENIGQRRTVEDEIVRADAVLTTGTSPPTTVGN
jgi:hypothetical protein